MSTLAQSTINAKKIKNVLQGADSANLTVGPHTEGNPANSMPIYDKDGVLLGYIPLYDNANLAS